MKVEYEGCVCHWVCRNLRLVKQFKWKGFIAYVKALYPIYKSNKGNV